MTDAATQAGATPITRRASAADVERLTALHLRCLPASILSSLGPKGVARYYRMALESPRETVFVAERDGEVVAGCVLSRAPGTLLRRFAVHAPVSLARDLGAGLYLSRTLRQRFVDRVRERGEPATELPEVVQIFTDPGHRGHGVGARLLRACEDHLRGLGDPAYCIHTLRDDNAPGIRFYEREGFTVVRSTRSFGDHYLVMTKGLA